MLRRQLQEVIEYLRDGNGELNENHSPIGKLLEAEAPDATDSVMQLLETDKASQRPGLNGET